MSFTPSSQVFALVDCNNFYASCERVFNPKLEGRPVIVLSNNDGCAIARSNEAKALGIKMGAPFFKIKDIVERHKVQVFSANFSLYGDLSRRVMATLDTFSPEVEIYSVDEAFINLTGFDCHDFDSYGRHIKATVKQWTGIPVSVGIAETKTLAKVAGEFAKKSPKANGVLDLTKSKYQELALHRLPVYEVWGVGRKISEKLNKKGITTALQLRDADDDYILRTFNVCLLRTVLELRGISCLQLELEAKPNKTIACTRSFAELTSDKTFLEQAVSSYTARASERLREQKLATKKLLVFIQTNRFRKSEPQYSRSAEVTLPIATDATPQLIHYARKGLDKIYRPEYRYHKAGVIMLDLIPASEIQTGLFDCVDREKSDRLMITLDRVNQIYGSNTLKYGAEGMGKRWRMKQEKLTPRYTTNWQELVEIE